MVLLQQFEGEFILLSVRRSLKYTFSSGNIKDIMLERGYEICHSTIIRWVREYSPLIAQKISMRVLRLQAYISEELKHEQMKQIVVAGSKSTKILDVIDIFKDVKRGRI